MVATDRPENASPDTQVPDVLTTLFGDNSRVQVITYLATNPDSVFLQNEIAEELDLSQPMVSRVANTLEEEGVIERTRDHTKKGNYAGITLVEDTTTAHIVDLLEDAE